MPDVNYVALIIAAIASMVVGFVWYGPLFGKAWMKLSGIKPEEMKKANKNMPKLYGTMYVASLLMAYVLGVFISYAGVTDVVGGATIGFWAWLGFIATMKLSEVLFEQRPMNLYYINVGYHLVVLVVMGAILAVWK